MRVAEIMARSLAEAGVKHAFGIPGGEILALVDALEAADIRYVTARHETAAGLMAEGAAAHDGAVALLVVTVGPGLSNAVNAVANAKLDRVPMLVISGAVDPSLRGSFTHQVFDQVALLAPLVKASFVAEPGTVAELMERALATARSHPAGPVHIDVPASLFTAEEPDSAASARSPQVEPADSLERTSTLLQLASMLRGAERPLLLCGLECTSLPVSSALRALGAACEIPSLTTYKAKGVLDELETSCLGAMGLSPRADAEVLPLLRAADVVLLVGYDPIELRAAYIQPFAQGARVLELAECPRTHGMHRSDLSVVGELSSSLHGLVSALQESPPGIDAAWQAQTQRVREALRRQAVPGSRFGPRSVVEVLSRALPVDVPVTLDTGAHRIVLSQAFHARRPGRILQSNGLCTMGYALPAAIGLSLAARRPVVAVMGDGGFEMVVGELATLRDLALVVVLVIFDDQSLALIDLKQQALGYARRAVWSGATDHVAVAAAFGGRGVRVQDSDALERELAAALAQPAGFSVISCQLARGAYEGLI
jgi:acetolactate synthase I/II/III large subunit